MMGYIYNKDTRVIATKITDIISCNDTTIKGNGLAVIGTGEYVIIDADYNEGDSLPSDVVDKRSEVTTLII